MPTRFTPSIGIIITTLLPLSIFISSHADPRADLIARTCHPTLVHNPDKYNQTYWHLLRDMEDEMKTVSFAFGEMGSPPDRLYVYSQCFDDLPSEDCGVCFDYIKDLLPSCFPASGGRVYADGCFIRAENYSFFEESSSPEDMSRCSDSRDESAKFRETASKALTDVVQMALENDGFAHLEIEQSDVPVYTMASCWKPLQGNACASCLEKAAETASLCFPSTEGRVLTAGCFLRYSDYQFANELVGISPRDSVLLYVACTFGAIAICSSVMFVGFFTGKLIYRSRNYRRSLSGLDMTVKEDFKSLQFKYSTLETATDSFSDTNKLGQGGYGEVFKGTLQDGREIAIKRLFMGGKAQEEDACNEIDIISGVQHKNLVRLLGCCFTFTSSFLVYEFLQNKSLDSILFDTKKKEELDWKRRLTVIIGTAEGLEYLHTYDMKIIHRDIKASNILLDGKYRPKIADFGLARFFSWDSNIVNVAIAGTLGYMAPEYLAEGLLTEKADVFSFGVLVLEVVTGLQNNKSKAEDSFETLATQVWNHFQSNSLADIVDESMEAEDIKEMTRVLQVGLLCTQEIPSARPAMAEVIQLLTTDIEIPIPDKPPFTDESMELSLLVGFNQKSLKFVASRKV